ncbi:protein phosphatase CheZ [uncultured Rhodospira sp.]|uniref:protein phosphatase CheZ n=1 Tax=uncultured Rhodospira sp. TaxID=1936189 RepID=UPI00262943AB|nr:protein phosphatase CheZ [uncultured Rhodospira sp.]
MATSRRPYTAELRRTSAGGPWQPHQAPAGVPAGNTDTATILAAIDGLAKRLGTLESNIEASGPDVRTKGNGAKEPPPPEWRKIDEARLLRTELIALAHSIDETKIELAKLRDQREDGDRLTVMATELDAIVDATETATNGILDIAEKMSGQIAEVQAHLKDTYVRGVVDEMQETLLGVFEHCNFQDLTGQRITKVVNTMKFIEERIERMMDIWGRDGFVVPEEDTAAAASQEERDRQLLNGPQTGAKGISQDEIDALFD